MSELSRMNPQNGKGSAPRKGANPSKFKDNYDKIFGKKDKTVARSLQSSQNVQDKKHL